MVALVYLSSGALTNSSSMALLSALVADGRLVLVCAGRPLAMAVVSRLRHVPPHREVLTLMVDTEVAAEERMLIEDLLREGTVPLILAVDDVTAELLVTGFRVATDRVLRLPEDAGPG